MFTNRYFWLITLVVLLLMLVPACGDDDDDDGDVTTPTVTTTSTGTTTPTVTDTPKEPVKIGAMGVWTGSAAISGTYFTDPVIKVVEKQVEDRGGILGGRPLKIMKYDTEGTTSGALAAATKAIIGDKLSVVAGGGVASPETISIAQVACDNGALYSSFTPLFDTPERECMVEATISSQLVIDAIVHVITEQVKPTPKTVAILVREGTGIRDYIDGWKKGYEGAGMETVYETIVPPDMTDFSPYLTQVRYHDPDVLLTLLGTEQYMAVAKNMAALGGWGDIQLVGDPGVTAAATTKGTEGWLTVTPWFLGMDNPESKQFIQDFEDINGRSPGISHIYFYFAFWTAIHAIELADTAEDGDAIIEAARSGELEFDSPMGPIHFNPDGRPDITMTTLRLEEGGNMVPVE